MLVTGTGVRAVVDVWWLCIAIFDLDRWAERFLWECVVCETQHIVRRTVSGDYYEKIFSHNRNSYRFTNNSQRGRTSDAGISQVRT